MATKKELRTIIHELVINVPFTHSSAQNGWYCPYCGQLTVADEYQRYNKFASEHAANCVIRRALDVLAEPVRNTPEQQKAACLHHLMMRGDTEY